MLANIPYERALVIAHPFRRPRQRTETTMERVLLVLTYLGLDPKLETVPRRISSIKKAALLVVNCHTKKEPYFHAVVWDPVNKRILDPYGKRAWPRRKYQRGLTHIIEIQNNPPA
jgi:hypothetical protein